MGDDTEEFYDDDLPDAPELDLGRRVDLDQLMRSGMVRLPVPLVEMNTKNTAKRWLKISSKNPTKPSLLETMSTGKSQDPGHRVFHDFEDEARDLKRQIAQEMGVEVEEEGGDEIHTVSTKMALNGGKTMMAPGGIALRAKKIGTLTKSESTDFGVHVNQ
ncbi:MAG: hypothetical protein Ct9H90mP16_07270 [Candidatus Poseidoniales archaeon]|nr:MAG: hypothetical protein Ct9H90mP16_07270 [Candidatus Poseidoniales archaeon]